MGLLKENYFLERAALGLIPGATPLLLDGESPALTTTLRTVWPSTVQTVYPFLLVATAAAWVASNSGDDAAAGTGARTVYLEGVNTSFVTVSETVTLNGTTEVNTANQYLSINTFRVVTTGSGLKNAGIIFFGTGASTGGSPAVPHATIQVGHNRSTSFLYTVPAGYTLLMYDLMIGAAGTTAGNIIAKIERATNLGLVFIDEIANFSNVGGFKTTYPLPIVFPEKTQFQLKALASAGGSIGIARANCILLNNSTGSLGI